MSPIAPRKALGVLAALLLFITLSTGHSAAQFIKTGTNVYQLISDGGLGVKVIASQAGIFLYDGDAVDLQLFDPRQLPVKKNTEHLFLEFSPEQNQFTALHLGDKRYSIAGSFTLNTSNLRITLAHDNSYLSVVYEKEDPVVYEILGIRGDEIVLSQSSYSASVLEANQFHEYQDVIDSYVVSEGQLLLGGKEIGTRPVGLALPLPKNACLQKDTVILPEKALNEVRSALDRTKTLEKAMDFWGHDRALRDLLILTNDDEIAIALAYEAGELYTIKPIANGFLCILEPLLLNPS